MSSISISQELSTPKRAAAMVAAVVGATAAQWTRALEAQRLAEKYLYLNEQALAARGTSRDAVIDRIRRVMTDKV